MQSFVYVTVVVTVTYFAELCVCYGGGNSDMPSGTSYDIKFEQTPGGLVLQSDGHLLLLCE